MSRSHRHSPITGNACAESEAEDKRIANRRFRRRFKRATDEWPNMRIISDIWAHAKDGKNWRGSDIAEMPGLMRK